MLYIASLYVYCYSFKFIQSCLYIYLIYRKMSNIYSKNILFQTRITYIYELIIFKVKQYIIYYISYSLDNLLLFQ